MAGDGGKLSLSRCVCVCSRKLLASEDGLDQGLLTPALLGWGKEQGGRYVVGPRVSESAELQQFRARGPGGSSKGPRSAGMPKGEGAVPMAGEGEAWAGAA